MQAVDNYFSEAMDGSILSKSTICDLDQTAFDDNETLSVLTNSENYTNPTEYYDPYLQTRQNDSHSGASSTSGHPLDPLFDLYASNPIVSGSCENSRSESSFSLTNSMTASYQNASSLENETVAHDSGIQKFFKDQINTLEMESSERVKSFAKLPKKAKKLNTSPVSKLNPMMKNTINHSMSPQQQRRISSSTCKVAKLRNNVFVKKPGTTKASTIVRRHPSGGKLCQFKDCVKRAQSNGKCKAHGGGARCQYPDCTKSSQGGGLCRSHGGGKRCKIVGCEKGTQRDGLCFLHGGVRHCKMEGCTKKDRGTGFCISHGGGKRCCVRDCDRAVRKNNRCRQHAIDKES